MLEMVVYVCKTRCFWERMSHLSFMYSEILAHPKGLTNQPTKSMNTVHIEKPVVCEISGYHGGEYEDDIFLRNSAV
jgi:hypothetical protein